MVFFVCFFTKQVVVEQAPLDWHLEKDLADRDSLKSTGQRWSKIGVQHDYPLVNMLLNF